MKPPAFQFYANDFLAGTAFMSAEEVGAYIRLLCYSWINGPIPSGDVALMRVAGCSLESLVAVREKFELRDGKLINAKLETVREAQRSYSERQTKSAHDRWHKPKPSNGNASAYPTAMPPHMPNACSSSSSSTSNINYDLNKADATAYALALPPHKPKSEPAPLVFPESLNTAEFVEAWKDWVAYRKEKGQTLKPTTIKAQIETMKDWGAVDAVASIRQSIRQGWQGIFEPRSNGQPKKSGGTSTYELEARAHGYTL